MRVEFLKAMATIVGMMLLATAGASNGQATCYRLEAVIRVEEPSASTPTMRTAADTSSLPKSEDTLILMANYAQILSKGMHYSYPVTYYFQVGSDQRIEGYRIEFVEPIINTLDPSFTPEDPSLDFKNFMTVIGKGDLQYEEVKNLETGEVTKRLRNVKKQTFPDVLLSTTVMTWERYLEWYLQFVSGKLSPAVKVGGFERYILKDGKVIMEVGRSGQSGAFFYPSDTESKSRAVLEVYELQDATLPRMVDKLTDRVVRTVIEFDQPVRVDAESAESLFALPKE